MVTLSEVPLVELEDVFEEDDYVGPLSEVVKDRPSNNSASSSNKPNEDQAAKRRRDENGAATSSSSSQQQRTTISLPATNLPLNTASSLAPGAVLYTPSHPSEVPRTKQTRRVHTRRSQSNGFQQGLDPLPSAAPPLNTNILPPRSSIHSLRPQRNTIVTNPLQSANQWLMYQNRLAPPLPGFGIGTSPSIPGPSNLNWGNSNQVLPIPNSLGHSQPLKPAQAHSSSATNQPHSLLQRPPPSQAPHRAHSSNITTANSPLMPTHLGQPILPPNHASLMFSSQAAPVRSAQEDFFRQLTAALPNIDVNQLYRQITTNPTQPIQLPVPAGLNSQAVQQQLQNSLESYMLQALNRGTFQPPQVQAQQQQPQPYQDILNDILADQQATLQQIQRPLVPPNEDDMAKQDQDADANQDDDFHEVETYADYEPAKLRIGQPHPDPIVETSSLATVEPPEVYYKLRLPPKVIESGQLSALQLESVIYASQQHNKLLPDELTRGGFLIGDGAGVGKGRTIAGIIFENYLCGRKKSIWLSVSTDLKLDAERDLRDIGAKNITVHLLGKFTYGKKIGIDEGVIFTTYSGLVSKSQTVKGQMGSRLGQLVQWAGPDFDGVIVFDECHKAKNISLDRTKKQQSKAAEYALEIQKRLPNARVVYASATGASETKHLGYMVRLGIWGKGTAYRTFHDFCGAIEKRGVGAMELVAVDLKMRGAYIARQLSFKTTSFEIRIANLNPSFIQLYDDCVELWAKALHHFQTAIDLCGDKMRRSWASFWAAHQKFFKYLCIGAKVPLVVQIATEALKEGKCVVIGLQSTGEAKTMEALEEGDINEFISTARATFESLVENHFPAPKRGQRKRTVQQPSSIANSPAKESNDSDTSTSVDDYWDQSLKELWGNNTNKVKRQEVEEKELSAEAMANKERLAKNQKVLAELAAEMRIKPRENGRAMRAAKRRNLKREKQSTRIKKPVDESDTDISNPLSVSSNERHGETSDETYSGGSSDEDEDDDDDEETEESSSNTVIDSDDQVSVKLKRQSKDESISAKGANKGDVSDSDSDVIITAVKPKKPPEIIFLDTDDEDETDVNDSCNSDEDGLYKSHPIRVHKQKLIELRDDLLNSIDKLGPRLPTNTLDDLIDQLGGPSKVAEMTGRKGRIVKYEDGHIGFRQRNDNDALDNMNIAEKERFMNGEKLVAIISEAASSGISLQADKRVKNTRRRVHITIELPWSADRAIQQFGRTHRSNQVCGPEYVFIISELAGERRFASIVAKRLESLGALTHGDRRATTDSRDLSQFNIANRYCKQALENLVRTIECKHSMVGDVKPDYPHGDFYRDAREAFVHSGLAKSGGTIWIPEAAAATRVNHFLNRLLGMKVGIQNAVFKLFTDYLDRLILRKKITGSYDSGILELNYDSGKTRCSEPEEFFLKTEGGVVKCSLRSVQVERGISWESAVELLEGAFQDKRNGFYTSTNPLTKAKSILMALREPNGGVDMFRTYKPNTGRSFKLQYISFIQEKSDKCTSRMAEKIWRHIHEKTDKQCVHLCFFKSCKRIEARLKCDVGMRHRNYCILSGGVLTAWPYLEYELPNATTKLQLVRLKLDAKNRVIGPIIPQDAIDKVRIALKKGEKGVEFC